ncbi:tetratricopeptide repeat protein [Aequorivita echinoideorum]|uniref:Tetratricopeptide repeat protein n=1 Tax=Aequorivita echinoideorum TaxID=1549647 RepID=A0ABS5S2F1_9FLAO|nr:tetratricopeptide repeat protein [Aequorivita echinoideorum]MBT0607385.1 tetratricopeptide repeat protein [Aequorivita echinoideorum]
MVGGFGSIQNMIITLRNNKNLLPNRKSFFESKNFKTTKREYHKVTGRQFNIKKASPEELLAIRKKIKSNRKRESRKFAILLCISLPLIFAGLYFGIYNFSLGFPELEVTSFQIQKDEIEKYHFYVNDGDAWLAKGNYHNAVFQYKKALQLFPNDFEANYRLALGYSYKCQYDFKDCRKGKILIDKLSEQFPHNQKIKEIEYIFHHWGE